MAAFAVHSLRHRNAAPIVRTLSCRGKGGTGRAPAVPDAIAIEMKQLVATLFAATVLISVSFAADENVRAAQNRLKDAGFYFGEPGGRWDSDTSSAVSRYQIRNGLPITGQLDAATAKSLGVKAAAAGGDSAPVDSSSWQRLRKADPQFIERRESVKPTRQGALSAPPPAKLARAVRPSSARAESPATVPTGSAGDALLVLSRERLRDYVAAFVLAGLDPRVGAELEFFADRVDYYGQGLVGREKIRLDLRQYNQRWPQRRFWLAGEVDVQPQADNLLRVSFPLRYELRNGARRSGGTVRKTLFLEVAGEDLQIVGVSERRLR